MIKRFIKLGFGSMSNTVFAAVVARILSMTNGNTAFVTPNPTLLDLNALLTAFTDALNAYGLTPGNRGTSTQKITMDNARAALEAGMVALANYAENVALYDGELLSSGGWDLRSEPNPVGIIGPVRDLIALKGDEVSFGEAQIEWKKPLIVNLNNVKSYVVYRGLTANLASAAYVATVTRSRYKDTGLTGVAYFYWVIPIGTAGPGIVSDVCIAYVTTSV